MKKSKYKLDSIYLTHVNIERGFVYTWNRKTKKLIRILDITEYDMSNLEDCFKVSHFIKHNDLLL